MRIPVVKYFLGEGDFCIRTNNTISIKVKIWISIKTDVIWLPSCIASETSRHRTAISKIHMAIIKLCF